MQGWTPPQRPQLVADASRGRPSGVGVRKRSRGRAPGGAGSLRKMRKDARWKRALPNAALRVQSSISLSLIHI